MLWHERRLRAGGGFSYCFADAAVLEVQSRGRGNVLLAAALLAVDLAQLLLEDQHVLRPIQK